MLGRALLSASVSISAPSVYVEDVFSTFLYTGNGSTQTITNGIALGDEVVIAPGTALGGGFFAGLISHTDNGVATHALIVAPAATGASGAGYTITTNLAWKTTNTTTASTTSPFDGAANSANMNNASHPAAQFCEGLSIGGYSDWYLPARYELDIAYENLKPTTDSNNTSYGINPYSVPERTVNRTAGAPARTSVAAFQSGGAEAFVADYHWSSTELSSTFAWFLVFSDGDQANGSKVITSRVRAFRKVPISDPSLDQYRVTGQGGLVWLKARTNAESHFLFDAVAGGTSGGALQSNSTNARGANNAAGVNQFNSDGFQLGTGLANDLNIPAVSWTFRKAPKFFDIATYTGNGSNRTIPHNLGSVPGTIIVKRTDTTSDWQVYHRSLANTEYMVLNSTAAKATGATRWNSTTPTSTEFSLGTDATVNASGGNYVAYLFAHDAGGFGDSGNDSVVSCGSYTGNGSASGPTVTLGWEPQWLIIKRTDATNNWKLFDNMRGFVVGGPEAELRPNSSNAEFIDTVSTASPLPTGFQIDTTDATVNASGGTYIYIAIRRGPMKTPTDATKVFKVNLETEIRNANAWNSLSGFPDDLAIVKSSSNAFNWWQSNRLTGKDSQLAFNSPNAEQLNNSWWRFDTQNGITADSILFNASSASYADYHFRRAPGFFDVVAYTGNASVRTVAHNLGVVPELMIVKARSVAGYDWLVYHAAIGNTKFIQLNYGGTEATQVAVWNSTTPTSTVFSLGNWESNANTVTYIAYLFATLPGVSKVGSYTGTGTTLSVDCGFTAGARFVLIKRTDSTGDWFVWDTARGIIAGNDPYLRLNSTAAEVTNTDYIDPLSSGFQISSTAPAAINANGGSYIYLSIA